MVFSGRTQSFVSGIHTSRRAASVPVAPIQMFSHGASNYGNTIDVVIEPTVRTKTFSVAPRSYIDADLYAASRTHDQQYIRDITARLPTIGFETKLPPAPIIVDPYISRIGYVSSSVPPVASSYQTFHHHHRSPSVDFRHRTHAHAPLAHRRSDEMEAEVRAFLESTPQSRHASHLPSYSSYSRSRSSPPRTYSSSYHHHYQQPTFHPPPPTFPPSYSLQHQYQPTGTGSSGWTTYGSYSSEIPLSHSTYAPSYYLSTQVSPPSPTHILNTPLLHSTDFASSVYRPLANYTPSTTQVRSISLHSRPPSYASAVPTHNFSPPSYGTGAGHGSGHISVDYALANKPAPLASQYASGYVPQQNDLPPLHTSSSSYSSSPRPRYDAKTFDLPKSSSSSSSKARSSSLDAPRPKANYKDVKAPMSDTRRRVRDLICKTRKDPSYYE